MNGRRAKKLRKIVYQGADYRERQYIRLGETNQIVNVAQMEEIDLGGGQRRKEPRRRIYRHLKKRTKKVSVKLLEKAIMNNENS